MHASAEPAPGNQGRGHQDVASVGPGWTGVMQGTIPPRPCVGWEIEGSGRTPKDNSRGFGRRVVRALNVFVGSCALLVCAGLAMAQDGAKDKADARSQAPASSPTSQGDLQVQRAFGGVRAFTKPSRDAIMGFSLPTQVMEIIAKGGQDVKKGDPLVRGDDAEELALMKLQKLSAETDLPVKHAKVVRDLAELEYKRVMEMREKGGSNQQEEDRARLNYESEKINYDTAVFKQEQEVVSLERMTARLTKYLLAAPFDGQVDKVEVDVGRSVSERDPVVRVVNVDPLWIDVPAPMWEASTGQLKLDAKAWVLVESAGKHQVREGKIIEISPVSDPGSRTRRVRVEVVNPKESRVVAGEPAWVRFTAPGEEVTKMIAEGSHISPSVTVAETSHTGPSGKQAGVQR